MEDTNLCRYKAIFKNELTKKRSTLELQNFGDPNTAKKQRRP